MTNSAMYPKFFARFYDVIYEHIRDHDDHEYFLRKILGGGGKVLEVGVGTGRFFIEAVNKGADIYGIDNSPEMIKVLQSKIDEQYSSRISIQDIRNFKFIHDFDLIIAPFRVFMHLLTTKDQIKALNNVYQHLKPGGQFVFDLFVPNMELLFNGIDNVMDFDGEFEPGKRVRRYTSMQADMVNQISNVTFKFVWEENNKELSSTWNTKLRFFFQYEIELLVKLSKLKLQNIYGDFNENELLPESRKFIVVCKK